jgi:hypothetical protein
MKYASIILFTLLVSCNCGECDVRTETHELKYTSSGGYEESTTVVEDKARNCNGEHQTGEEIVNIDDAKGQKTIKQTKVCY